MASSVPLKKANLSFCLDMLRKLSEEDNTKNIFFSPFSISAALAMVMLGAAGITADQISEVLGFTETKDATSEGEQPESTAEPTRQPLWRRERPVMQTQQTSKLPSYLLKVFSGCPQCLRPRSDDQDDVHSEFSRLLLQFSKTNAPYDLSVATRLYGEQSYDFVEDFLDDTKKLYKAELEKVDFKSSAEEARININNWVEKQTQGKIQDLLVSGVVDHMTKLVLVNAIYFKGKWVKPFKVEDTIDGKFRINKIETKPVKMMQQKSKFLINASPEHKCQILEMPYMGNELSMIIILPDGIEDDTTGLEKLEKELTFETFREWTLPDNMGKNEVQVSLPRFKLEEMYDLKEPLTSMGMEDAFDVSRSNFSGMSTANDLMLSQVVHKAFVDVNEEGTEAAAATGAVISSRSFTIPDTFIADHPFLFFIQHKTTETVLFAGRYCSPE